MLGAKYIATVLLMILMCGSSLNAQEPVIENDSLLITKGEELVKPKKTRFLIPKKSAMYSAVFPGLGQAYNHKYYKIPFIYAGIAATGYGIWWNNKFYNTYRNAYIDIRDSDPNSERYLEVLPPGYNFDEQGAEWRRWFESQLEKKKDSYRRDRDLLVIVMVGVYVINIIDANVDAHLSDFDISNDLSMNVSPVLLGDYFGSGNSSLGLSLRLNF